MMAILTASSKLWSETALISVTRATVKRYSFLRLSLKDFLPLHLGFANASVIPVYAHIGLAIILLGSLSLSPDLGDLGYAGSGPFGAERKLCGRTSPPAIG